jgi:predicted lipoprotein with Yx(FWY)xxD motif
VAPTPADEATPTEQAAPTDATVQVVDSEHGEILADGEGRTVYVFLRDEGGQSNCTDACAETWPPLSADGDPVAGDGADEDLLGTIEREDGSTQLTYNERPLYHYAADTSAGDTNGQGVGDNWYVVSPEGEPVQNGS